MAGSILPLPVMLDEEDQKIYDKLEVPKSIVVRYGYMRMVAELPYDGEAKPGCGSKLVIRTARGIELGEMLTTTCPNSGCGKAVSRKEMLDYIDNSGGKNFPFTTQGRILRVATVEDVLEQQRLDANKLAIIQSTRAAVRELDLKMKLVDVELLLGGERMIFHYTSEDWVDFRELVRRLAADHQTRIEMHQVNARDEARIVADYEKCGQHCCCKQFLKVLKPVSMKSAKIQKATLDPTKISGRCGRLMCCLRYEDETYDDLRKRLPKRQTRWMTPDGAGTVIDTQILTQLALIVLDKDNSTAAYPLENITALTKEEDEKLQEEMQARMDREQRPPRRDDRRPPPREQGPRPEGQRGDQRNEPRGEPRAEQRGESRGEPRGDRARDERPPRGEQRGEQRGDQRGGSPRGPSQPQQGGGDRPQRPPQNRKEEPRRPQPGKPLEDDEVESREGDSSPGRGDQMLSGEERTESRFNEEAVEPRAQRDQPPLSDSEDDEGNDGPEGDGPEDGQTEGTTGEGATPGQEGGEAGRRRKRRRRRRRRGGGGGQGGEGGPAAGPSSGGSPG